MMFPHAPPDRRVHCPGLCRRSDHKQIYKAGIDYFEVTFMNPVELTASVTAISNALACQLPDDQLELAGALFTQLGDTLTTISVMRGICSKNKSGTAEIGKTTAADESVTAEVS